MSGIHKSTNSEHVNFQGHSVKKKSATAKTEEMNDIFSTAKKDFNQVELCPNDAISIMTPSERRLKETVKKDVSKEIKQIEAKRAEEARIKKAHSQVKVVSSRRSRIDVKYAGKAEDLELRLKGTPLEGHAQAFINAQNEYGVNAFFLMGITKTESGYGKHIPHTKGHNLAGIRKRDGSYRKFKSHEACIDYLARIIKRGYVNKNNCTIGGIQHRYSESHAWADSVKTEMNTIKKTINSKNIAEAKLQAETEAKAKDLTNKRMGLVFKNLSEQAF